MRKLTTWALAGSMAAASAAWAGDEQSKAEAQHKAGAQQKAAAQQAGAQGKQQTQQRASAQSGDGRIAVLGEVVDARGIQLAGAAGNQHQLVKLRTGQGDTIVVDLGAGQAATQVQKGDRILAIGRAARIDEKPVLFAKFFGEMHAVGSVAGQEGAVSRR